MNIFRQFYAEIETIVEALSADGALPRGLDTAAVTVEPPRDPAHGDLASNVALVLARQARRQPREIAALVADVSPGNAAVERVDIAGPGFINLPLTRGSGGNASAMCLAAGKRYAESDLGAEREVNVEYVSVNPTGPLHVGTRAARCGGCAVVASREGGVSRHPRVLHQRRRRPGPTRSAGRPTCATARRSAKPSTRRLWRGSIPAIT